MRDTQHRDHAYHQGTVWSWLIGPFIRAWKRFLLRTSSLRLAAPAQSLPAASLPLAHFRDFDGDAPTLPKVRSLKLGLLLN